MQGVAEAGFFRNLRILEEKQAQSKNSAHLLESTFSYNAFFLSSRAVCQHGVAIHNPQNAKVDSRNAFFASAKFMDCHANASALARNDSKLDSTTGATTLHESAQDSKTFTQNAQILHESQAETKVDSRNEAQNLNESAQDSRILDEKCGLQGKSQGSYLDGDLWDFSPLPHFSLKAESSKKAESLLKVAYAA